MCNCFKCVSLHNCDRTADYKTDFEKRMLACIKCNVHSDCDVCKYAINVNKEKGTLLCTNSSAWGCKNEKAL